MFFRYNYQMEKYHHTASKGELTKVNLEGCKSCGRVYVSFYNGAKLGRSTGWYNLHDLQQEHPGDQDKDIVIRVRGRRWGGILGQRVCPDCKVSGVK